MTVAGSAPSYGDSGSAAGDNSSHGGPVPRLAVSLKQRLAAREPLAGVILPVAEPSLVEICAYSGFDLVMLDLEHSVSSDAMAEHAIRAAESAGIYVVARAAQQELPRLSRFLDAGGHGVIVAKVTSAMEAQAIVNACCLPPLGSRGAGVTRVSRYGLRATSRQWMNDENARVAVGIQIEDRRGVDDVVDIVSRAGVDLVVVGPRDLSMDLGVPGESDAPEMRTAIARVADACEQIRLPWAMPTDSNSHDGYAPQLRLISLSAIVGAAPFATEARA